MDTTRTPSAALPLAKDRANTRLGILPIRAFLNEPTRRDSPASQGMFSGCPRGSAGGVGRDLPIAS